MVFRVFTDDNFHYQDESERSDDGAYATYEEAVVAARAIVERSLRWEYRPGMTAEQLWEQYQDFGDDPFIRPEPEGQHFSAWEYARELSAQIAADQSSRPAV